MANIIGQPPPKFLLMRLNRTNQEGRAKAAKIQAELRAEARRPDGVIQASNEPGLARLFTAVLGSACDDPDCPTCGGRGLPAGYSDDTTPKH